jgi:pyrroloquinoline quinone (PQQ) biosynthesis protein C
MKELLEDCVSDLSQRIDAFPWERRSAYADWLTQTYYYVRHSTRLLAAAAARLAFDEASSKLHHRFGAHIGEEAKHELLALHDLRDIGGSLDAAGERDSTRMFYEPQYYKIEHEHPVALFGYILVLEAMGPAVGEKLIARLVRAYGERCVAFIKLHAREDVDHVAKAVEMVAGLPEIQKRFVERNVRQTTRAYVGMLGEIAA